MNNSLILIPVQEDIQLPKRLCPEICFGEKQNIVCRFLDFFMVLYSIGPTFCFHVNIMRAFLLSLDSERIERTSPSGLPCEGCGVTPGTD